jgi:hypothetical protein
MGSPEMLMKRNQKSSLLNEYNIKDYLMQQNRLSNTSILDRTYFKDENSNGRKRT